MAKLKLLILGGGNGPHCYAGLASSLPDVEVRVLTLYADEAERWTNTMKDAFEITFQDWEPGKDKIFTTKPHIVSNDPKEVVPGAHLIVFMVPSFAHTQYFAAIEPHLDDGVIICGLPGGGGFMFQALHSLGPKVGKSCLMSFETLPWACRITQFDRSATILATKTTISGGGMGNLIDKKTVIGLSPSETLQYTLLGRTEITLKGHLLGDTLNYGNAFVHPNIEYGTWKNWDGQPVDEPPDFYHGANELAAKMVAATSDEAMRIRDAIKAARPDINLTQVIHKYDWYCQTYSDDTVADKSNIYTIFHTHKGYNGIKHPMVKTEDGKYLPDFSYRYFTEDIPCGQVVLKGIAQIMDVDTPNLDEVIIWAQAKMGKEYLIDGKLVGKDVNETRCPQKFGITTLEGMLGEV